MILNWCPLQCARASGNWTRLDSALEMLQSHPKESSQINQSLAVATETIDVDNDSRLMPSTMCKGKQKPDEADSALEMLQSRLKEPSQINQSLAAMMETIDVNDDSELMPLQSARASGNRTRMTLLWRCSKAAWTSLVKSSNLLLPLLSPSQSSIQSAPPLLATWRTPSCNFPSGSKRMPSLPSPNSSWT